MGSARIIPRTTREVGLRTSSRSSSRTSRAVAVLALVTVMSLFGGQFVSVGNAAPNSGDTKLLDGNGSDQSNNPKPSGCTFSVSWSGYDSSEVVFYRFVSHPAGQVLFPSTSKTLSAAGAGPGGDGTAGPFTFTPALLANVAFTNNQGYQVQFESAPDGTFTNNVKTKTFFVEAACGRDVRLTKSSDKTTITQIIEQVTFTITVTNAAGVVSEDLLVTDTLPAGLTYVSSTNPGGSACTTSGTGPTTISCKLGVVAAGATKTITITATGSTLGLKTNSATVTHDDNTLSAADLTPADNTATADVTVVAPVTTGTITVRKKVVGAGADPAQTFAFTDSMLTSDVGSISDNSGLQTYTVAPGTYDISENTPPANWAFETPIGLTCTDPTNNTTVNQGSREALIRVAVGETVACEWTNRYTAPATTGVITVEKKVVGAGADPAQTFAFTDDITAQNVGSISASSGLQSFTVTAGTYNISENAPLPANWAFVTPTGLVCTDLTANTTVNQTTRAAAINVGVGETVACEWTNRYTAPPNTGTITVQKKVVGAGADPAQTFAFTDDMPNSSVGTISANSGIQSYTVTVGTYNISENPLPANWAFETNGLSCTDPTPNTTVDQTTRAVEIKVSDNETVACEWTNRYTAPATTGTLIIDKVASDPGASQTESFAFTDDITVGGAVGSVTPATSLASKTFTVTAGTYSVTEDALTVGQGLAGWTQGTATCDDTSPVNAIAVAVGETVKCTYNNSFAAPPPPRGSGTITVQKQVIGTGADPAQTFAFTDDMPTSSVGSISSNSGLQTFTVTAGIYNISEDALPANWSLELLTGLVCTDPSGGTSVNQTTRGAAIDVAAGETVACEWTNRYTAPVIVPGQPPPPPVLPDLVISKTGSSASVPVGSNVTYTLTITNKSTVDAPNAVVTDTLPAGLQFVSSTPGAPTCTNSHNIVTAVDTLTCALGTIAAGATTSVTVVAKALSPGTYTNVASIGPADATPLDNTDDEVTEVTPIANPDPSNDNDDTDDTDVPIDEVLGSVITDPVKPGPEVLGARDVKGRPSKVLPFTGSDPRMHVIVGTWMLLVGLGCLILADRRKPTHVVRRRRVRRGGRDRVSV